MTTPGSDEKLRELERRWRQTGSVEDEAAYLIERVRVGDLTQERLDLAAYCGHVGARIAVGDAATPSPPADIVSWVAGLDAFGPDVAREAEAVRRRDSGTYVQEWALTFTFDRQHITKRVTGAYARALVPWALGGDPADRP